ncbi:glycine betaine/proline transport system substrate-binding protein [Sulfitobacter brevis]|uniref:Glycine betaine/proline transport system substrate-binding protein n=1 Tax=Sulfitobacter brevis TaxID=74348 RepID=A0A1I2F0I2_9RHOB|nr:choline ABC transporter substrate-binding protein [Sulfitobacter brevis]SFE98519.1 glycine betaine/proline transport system substrate-binding protein [Sulfitobacter brevis]
MTGKLIFTTTALVLCAHQATANCDTVRMAEPGWTDLALTTGVASVVLEGLGYTAESDVLGIPVIYESMVGGDLDVFLGYWDPAMESYFQAYRESGNIETVHQNLEGAKFTFAVPKYVYDAGVTDFADLASHADKFGSQMYGIEPGSNDVMLGIVEADAFGLSGWKVVESSEQGMLAQVKRNARSEEWIVFLGWAPHPMNTAFDIEYLTGGDDHYGPNFGGATVHTQVRKGYLEECPNVGRLLTQMTFDVPMESAGMAYILDDGDDPKEAGARLLREQPQYLEAWLDGVEARDGGNGLDAVRAHLGE